MGNPIRGIHAPALPHPSATPLPAVSEPPLRALAFVAPLGVVATLLAIYLAAPGFYARYVLEYQHREYQAVEVATVLLATVAGVLLLVAGFRVWAARDRSSRAGALAAAVIGAVGAAALFFAAEEVSWGQTFVNWGIPENEKPQLRETNLHNNLDLPLQSVGQLFLAAVLFLLPALWVLRPRVPLSDAWWPAVAEAPVVFAAAVAFLWKTVKEVYVGLFGTDDDDDFYWGFVEQINEQRELLIALALLLYAVYRVRAARLWAARERPAEPAA